MVFQYTILTFVDSFFTLLTLKNKLLKLQMILTNSLLDARSHCNRQLYTTGQKVYVRRGQILFVNALLFLDL